MKVKLFYKLFTAFLFVALFPIFVGSCLFTGTIETYLYNHIQKEAVTRLDRSASGMTDAIKHVGHTLEKSARHIRFVDDDSKVVKWLYDSHPQLNKIIVVDMDGVVQTAISRFSHIPKGKVLPACNPPDVDKRKIRFTRWNNEPLIVIHYPVYSLSTGEQRGVLHTEINITSLFQRSAKETGRHTQYIINAYDGHIVSHPNFNLVLNRQDASAVSIVQQVMAGADFAHGEYENIKGDRVVGFARSTPDLPFVLVEETPFQVVYSLLIKRKKMRISMIWASCVFIFVTAFLFSRSITRPVTRLLAVMTKIEQGYMGVSIPHRKAWLPDEITLFGNHFQRMVEALKNDRKKRDEAVQKEQLAQEALRKSQKMEAIGLLAGGVAHDLNNILSGIVSYPELLLLQLPEDSELRQPIQIIKDSGVRASEVVADLLTVARGVAATREVCNLNELINELFASPECKELHAAHPDISCEQDPAADLLNISCSPLHVKKCIMNLVANAVEAMGDSGIMTVSTRNQYVDQPIVAGQTLEPGEYAVVHIGDSGGGITEKDRDRIFEPFYSKKFMGRSGTGLGLTVVWNTIHDHDGAVSVASSEKGTVFELYFPVTKQEKKPLAEQDNMVLPHGHGEQILIVDDVEEQREIGSLILKQLGYGVESVSSGEEAIRYLAKNSVDLVLLDMVMDPGISGRDTYERIIATHPGQKALIASGYSESDDVTATLKLGAGGFIKKPYSMDQLGQAVLEVLGAQSSD